MRLSSLTADSSETIEFQHKTMRMLFSFQSSQDSSPTHNYQNITAQ